MGVPRRARPAGCSRDPNEVPAVPDVVGGCSGSVSRGARRRGLGAAAAAVTVWLSVVACSSGTAPPGAPERGGGSAGAQRQLSAEYWSDPESKAAVAARGLRAQGRAADADQIDKIATQPVAYWPTGQTATVQGDFARVMSEAGAARRTPVLVAYNIPGRDCGQFSSGGAGGTMDYRSWVNNFLAGMAGRTAVVILEPDALPQTLNGCVPPQQRDQRWQLLTEATADFARAGNMVYIDAGGPGFVTDVGQLANGLRRAGVGQAAGFSLNVSNFAATDDVVAYGRQVSAKVGKPFVVDTSRNGRGTYRGDNHGAPATCNPPGRALGTPPTSHPGRPGVDAYLWIKKPGESDGACQPGAPEAGQWWPSYALDLARNSP